MPATALTFAGSFIATWYRSEDYTPAAGANLHAIGGDKALACLILAPFPARSLARLHMH